MRLRTGNCLALGIAALVQLSSGSTLHAQEMVQALPAQGSEELGDALQRLARNGNDVNALLDAGDASLMLGDVAAAIGFFGRAQAITSDNPRIALGLARAYTLSRRPVEALRLFAEAERGGIALADMAADRGLAFDLVGDSASAQQLYRLAIENGAADGTLRNLALSQAISGDKSGFEATLLPLLQQGDFAAFRTRSFGLAILGDAEAAVKIARDMMSEQMATRIEPYLRYMSQLTPAQQAAAGALGVFPRVAAIGRDDREIATYASSNDQQARNADRSLTPTGRPLGGQEAQGSQSAQGELPAIGNADELPPVQRAEATRPVDLGPQPARQSAPNPSPTPASAPSENLEDAFADFALVENPSTSPQAGAVDIRAIDAARENTAPAAEPHPARFWVQVATGRDIEALGFDWRRIARNADGALAGKSAFTTPWGQANRLLAGPYDSSADAREVVNLLRSAGQDSFAFTSEDGQEIFPLTGAPTAPEAAQPAHPSRHWVQVATGRDLSALGFDWRRIERRADGALEGMGPFTVRWGAANRLLAGPYESAAEARAMVNRLKALGIDTFPFTSEDGEAIEPLE